VEGGQVVIVGLTDAHTTRAPVARLFRMPDRDRDLFGGDFLQQRLDDEPAVLASGSGDENHGVPPLQSLQPATA